MGSELNMPADAARDVRTLSRNSFLLTLVAAAAILLANLGTIMAVRSDAHRHGLVPGSEGPAVAGDTAGRGNPHSPVRPAPPSTP